MDPNAIQTYADLEDTYWWYLGRREVIRNLIYSRLSGPLRILDWGCGPGGNYQMLLRFGSVTSVDASDLSLELCRKRGIRDLIKASKLQELPVGALFDLVTTFDVIEHIEDDSGFLQELRAVLKDNGHVLVTAPAYQFLWSDLDRLLGHVRRYNKRDLVHCFETAGYTVIASSYFNSFLAAPFMAVRWMQMLSGRASTLKEYAVKLPVWLNYLFLLLLKTEALLVPLVPLPFGTSIIVLAKKSGS